jgi:DNA-binding IclR family transcriptional regulator
MTNEVVAVDIKEFILAHIDSIAQLEALLLLRANPEKLWDAAAAARRLYISESEAQEILARLRAEGLVSGHSIAYRYAPGTEKALVDRLAEAYARHLIPITHIIHQRPSRIREFADAFKLKKER